MLRICEYILGQFEMQKYVNWPRGVANNEFTLIIAASTTAAYTFNTAVYDIEIEKDNEVTRLLQGKIKLSKEVTI